MKVFLKILKYTFFALCAFVFFGICFRFLQASCPYAYRSVEWTPALRAAYTEDKEAFTVERQQLRSYITDEGYFHGNYIYFCDAAEQMQLTVWYNKSTVEKLCGKYNLETLGDTPFRFEIADENGVVCGEAPVVVKSTVRGRYTFIKLTVDGIRTTEHEKLYMRFICPAADNEEIVKLMVTQTGMERSTASYKVPEDLQ